MKGAPFSELTIEPHAPVHHSGELHGDGESQTCAAEASGHGAIGLAEGLKNDFPAVHRNPWSSIPHGEMQYDRRRSVGGLDVRGIVSSLHNHVDFTSVCEFYGIADQIDDDLPKPMGISHQGIRHVRRNAAG